MRGRVHTPVQIQDVGLIFLSAMASSIATACLEAGQSPQVALASTLVTTALSTLAVGLGTILVGESCVCGVGRGRWRERRERVGACPSLTLPHAVPARTNAGKFRLAQLVQYMPLPVVGGYLVSSCNKCPLPLSSECLA